MSARQPASQPDYALLRPARASAPTRGRESIGGCGAATTSQLSPCEVKGTFTCKLPALATSRVHLHWQSRDLHTALSQLLLSTAPCLPTPVPAATATVTPLAPPPASPAPGGTADRCPCCRCRACCCFYCRCCRRCGQRRSTCAIARARHARARRREKNRGNRDYRARVFCGRGGRL